MNGQSSITLEDGFKLNFSGISYVDGKEISWMSPNSDGTVTVESISGRPGSTGTGGVVTATTSDALLIGGDNVGTLLGSDGNNDFVLGGGNQDVITGHGIRSYPVSGLRLGQAFEKSGERGRFRVLTPVWNG